MNCTAKELQEYVLTSIEYLCHLPGRSNKQVYKELAQYSGLSLNRVRYLHNGTYPNLTVDALDRLVDAVKQAMRKAAA
jgi:hypothetical protein